MIRSQEPASTAGRDAPSISVVMPSFRRPARLRIALTAVAAALARSGVSGEAIVVDDSGAGAMRPVVAPVVERFAFLSIRLLEPPHGGRSAARNHGARESRGEILLFLDDDVIAMGDLLRCHLEAHQAERGRLVRGSIFHMARMSLFDDPEAGLPTPRARERLAGCALRPVTMLEADGSPSPALSAMARMIPFERDLHRILAPGASGRRWPGATGAHLSIRREDFLRLGGFDENMGRRWGAEDLEFGYRAEQDGCFIHHEPEALVLHMDHDSGGRAGDHAQALDYFAAKHANPAILRLGAYFAGACPLEDVVA